MDMMRWDPLREMQETSERLNRLLRRPEGSQRPRESGAREALTVADWSPNVDISETEAEYLIRVELPGVKKEDVKITVQEGVLLIQGVRHQEHDEPGRRHHRVECSYGSFVRSFTLPDYIDGAKISAEYRDGLLYLHLSKTEQARPKSIEVKVT